MTVVSLEMSDEPLFSLAAIVALSSFIAPQTASAYKYHVTLPDGSHEVFDAKNSAEAVHYFREHYNEGVLMKRPNGGILDFQ